MIFTLTIEIEYIALEYVVREVVWIKQFINKLGLNTIEDLTIFSNNEINIAQT